MSSKPTGARRGAKGKYTPEKVKEICKTLETGMSNRDACILNDITEETFYTWIETHPEFSEAVKKAHSKNKQRSVLLIQKAAEQTWQAAAWWLERKYKDEYAKREEITGKEGNPLYDKVEIELKKPTKEA